jgi:hypothetical protein
MVAKYNPIEKCVVYFIVYSQVFGGKSAPLNFSRYPAIHMICMAYLFLVPMTHCVDDAICIEGAVTIETVRSV